MSITRKIVLTKDYRIMNLSKKMNLNDTNQYIGYIIIDIQNHRIGLIAGPIQPIRLYNSCLVEWIFYRGVRCDNDICILNISNSIYILSQNDGYNIAHYNFDNSRIELIPFIRDTLGDIDIISNNKLLSNLYEQCVESLLEKRNPSETTFQSHQVGELMAYVYGVSDVSQNDTLPVGLVLPQGNFW